MTGKPPLQTVSYDAIDNSRRGAQSRTVDVACPICGPQHEGTSARRKVLRTWSIGGDRISLRCARCGLKGYVAPDGNRAAASRPSPSPTPDIRDEEEERKRRRNAEAAERIWRETVPIAGTAG